MVHLGMDVDVVRDVAARLDAQSHCLDGIVGAVDTLSSTAVGVWLGHDAREFHDCWHHTHRPGLRGLVEALAQYAALLLHNVAEQEHASGGSSSGAAASTAHGASRPTPAPAQPSAPGALPPSGGSAAYHNAMHVGANGYDQWGKAPDNCTSWAAFRRSELGLSIPPGNGGAMGHDASLPPTPGAIASYGAGTDAAPGHVMIVEEVMSSGKFRVSEMNINGHGEFRDTQIWDRQPDGTWRSELTGKIQTIKFTP